jgi:protein-S-isoprenylcysteine O-methyltransferase Ste14
MYVGLILLYVGASPALGSWWGVLGALPMVATLAWRLVDEESVLVTQLKGYGDYRRQVRYRLLPFVW